MHYLGRAVDRAVLPMVPMRFRLAVQYFRHVCLLDWEPECRCIGRYVKPGGIALDVGANMGLWSYAMAKSRLFDQIVAFEPNRTLTGPLEAARIDGLRVIHKAVSDSSRIDILNIPRLGAVVHSGWASLESQLDLDADGIDEMEVQTVRLDDLDLSRIGFIKIDVEGHESRVLRGARTLIASNRPVCLIECRDRNLQEVEEFFDGLGVGYRWVDAPREVGFPLSPGNFLIKATP